MISSMTTSSFCLIVGYVAGFFVFPLFLSFVDGWPFFDRKSDGWDLGFTFGASLLWPVVTVVYLVAVWWCGMSWLGVKIRKRVSR